MIAAAADKIVAQPGTLTGSIGVLFGHFDLSGMLRKQRITAEVTCSGSEPLSLLRPLTKRQKERFEQIVEASYTSFVDKVAAGRSISRRRVKRYAKGRVWTGEQAMRRGLVDALGGLEEAVVIACEEAGIADKLRADEVDRREMSSLSFGWDPFSSASLASVLPCAAAALLQAAGMASVVGTMLTAQDSVEKLLQHVRCSEAMLLARLQPEVELF